MLPYRTAEELLCGPGRNLWIPGAVRGGHYKKPDPYTVLVIEREALREAVGKTAPLRS